MSTHSKLKVETLENGVKITTFSNRFEPAPVEEPVKRKAQTTAGKASKLSNQRTDMKAKKLASYNRKVGGREEAARNKKKEKK